MNKGIIKKSFTILCCSLLMILIIPFNIIKASSSYYSITTFPNCQYYTKNSNNSIYSYKYFQDVSTNEIRAVVIGSYIYFISLGQFKYRNGFGSTEACPNDIASNYLNTVRSARTYGNVTYFYLETGTNETYTDTNINIPVYTDDPNINNYDEAYMRTYGELAVGPVTYGNIIDIQFYTNFINASLDKNSNNMDIISWNNKVDSLGNDLSDFNFEIRAIPTYYNASTKSSLENQTMQDLHERIDYAVLFNYINSVDNVSYNWGDIWNYIYINLGDMLGGGYVPQVANLYETISYDNSFYKFGWFYQIRFTNDDYTSDWQTIYTTTTAPYSQTKGLDSNNVTFNQQTYNLINNTNTTNNSTTNYYINNTEINNNYGGGYNTDVNGKPWYAYLLELITNFINKILDILGGIFSDIIDGIVDLIKDLDIDLLGIFKTIFNTIKDFFDNLDFEDTIWQFPEAWSTNLTNFTNMTNGILNVWFNNGLGLFILVPLLIWLIGVIL